MNCEQNEHVCLTDCAWVRLSLNAVVENCALLCCTEGLQSMLEQQQATVCSSCALKAHIVAPLHDATVVVVVQDTHRRVHFPAHFAQQLALKEELKGHNGCVNRLAWNEDGSLLASGSDDRRVRPDTRRIAVAASPAD